MILSYNLYLILVLSWLYSKCHVVSACEVICNCYSEVFSFFNSWYCALCTSMRYCSFYWLFSGPACLREWCSELFFSTQQFVQGHLMYSSVVFFHTFRYSKLSLWKNHSHVPREILSYQWYRSGMKEDWGQHCEVHCIALGLTVKLHLQNNHLFSVCQEGDDPIKCYFWFHRSLKFICLI